jgi:hypothetical protein
MLGGQNMDPILVIVVGVLLFFMAARAPKLTRFQDVIGIGGAIGGVVMILVGLIQLLGPIVTWILLGFVALLVAFVLYVGHAVPSIDYD